LFDTPCASRTQLVQEGPQLATWPGTSVTTETSLELTFAVSLMTASLSPSIAMARGCMSAAKRATGTGVAPGATTLSISDSVEA
jgi:hypothetical protein